MTRSESSRATGMFVRHIRQHQIRPTRFDTNYGCSTSAYPLLCGSGSFGRTGSRGAGDGPGRLDHPEDLVQRGVRIGRRTGQ